MWSLAAAPVWVISLQHQNFLLLCAFFCVIPWSSPEPVLTGSLHWISTVHCCVETKLFSVSRFSSAEARQQQESHPNSRDAVLSQSLWVSGSVGHTVRTGVWVPATVSLSSVTKLSCIKHTGLHQTSLSWTSICDLLLFLGKSLESWRLNETCYWITERWRDSDGPTAPLCGPLQNCSITAWRCLHEPVHAVRHYSLCPHA